MTELSILYQDDSLVAVDKPAGMLVHAGREPEPRDQIAMKVLKDQLGTFIHTIHRLDRPTSGVLLFALQKPMQRQMQALFEQGQIQKGYWALVVGSAPEEKRVEIPLRKSEDAPLRPCTTTIRRLADWPTLGVSLVEALPETGRIHQIRQHLQALGHPIAGDYLYGSIEQNDEMNEALKLGRMMLMARTLCFAHPLTGQALTIEAPLPPVFARFAPDPA